MKDIYILGYAQNQILSDAGAANEVELIMPVVHEVFKQTGLNQDNIDFTCSGSCDYLQGAAFAFVEGLSAIQTNPPIKESHVEMDAAWALFESILKIQMGDAESALIYGFGKSSPGNLDSIVSLQTDPYYLAPLWADRVSLAALQARVLLDKSIITKDSMFDAIQQAMTNAQNNQNSLVQSSPSLDQYLDSEFISSPLNKFDCSPISDGASAMIIGTKEFAENINRKFVCINSIHHNIETSNLGARDLTTSKSITSLAKLIQLDQIKLDFAELHTQFSFEAPFISNLIGLQDIPVNLSGGPLSGNVVMAAGLDAIGKSYESLLNNNYSNALAHATSGPCLQQNMLVHLERKQ